MTFRISLGKQTVCTTKRPSFSVKRSMKLSTAWISSWSLDRRKLLVRSFDVTLCLNLVKFSQKNTQTGADLRILDLKTQKKKLRMKYCLQELARGVDILNNYRVWYCSRYPMRSNSTFPAWFRNIKVKPCCFEVLNFTGICKILKKFDKNCLHWPHRNT